MNRSFKQAVILAGGRGKRLKPLTDDLPKALIEFHGKPFLGYLLDLLHEQGITDILLLLGYRAGQIQAYCGDGSAWNLKIEYSVTAEENDTGKRLKLAEPQIDSRFLLMYCDNYWPMDLDRMISQLENQQLDNMVTVYNNSDNYTKSNLRVSKDGKVVHYDKTRTDRYLMGVDIGYFILDHAVLKLLPDGNPSFEKTVMQQLITDGQLAAFQTDHRYYSVGGFNRLELTDKFFRREPTIILDRDGVLNRKAPKAEYVTVWEDFTWLPGSREAVLALTKKGYRIIIVTNQAGIARNKLTEADLAELHNQLQMDLQIDGGKIDAIYHCPHHWDDNCFCRKPKPGMLFQAQRENQLDLSRVMFIGDDIRDSEAAAAASMPFILFKEDDSLLEIITQAKII